MTNKELLLKIKENECCLIRQIPLNNEEINSIMLNAKNIIKTLFIANCFILYLLKFLLYLYVCFIFLFLSFFILKMIKTENIPNRTFSY